MVVSLQKVDAIIFPHPLRSGSSDLAPADSHLEGKPEVKKTRLFAGVFAENTGSMHILEKCGFQKEGVQRGHVVTRHGHVTDLHLYGLNFNDWETRKKKA